MEKDKGVLKYLSLFAGIGGFEVGIQNSKYGDTLKCIGYSEIDVYADSIYSKNFPSRMEKGIQTHKPFGDVRYIETSTLPNFDLLVGGFPCQAFSNAGYRRGFDDTRGTLFFEIARILADKRPRYFLLENVKGLLYHEKGETFKRILEILSQLGYNVQWEIFNSKNFGVPQNRERIYIKGYSRASCGSEVLSEPRASGQTDKKMTAYTSPTRNCKIMDVNGINGALTTGGKDSGFNSLILTDNISRCDDPKVEVIVDTPFLQNRAMGINGVSMGLTATNYKHPYKVAIEIGDENLPKSIGNVNPSGRGINGKVWDADNVSPTITINKGEGLKIAVSNDNDDCLEEDKGYVKIKNGTKLGYLEAEKGEDGILVGRLHSETRRGRVQPKSTGSLDTQPSWGVYQNYHIRRLTPLECERLQAFPDNWTKWGKDGEIISNTQRYKCIGNAVTTSVITFIMNNWELN